ncbi:YqaE/Pmp3 family membrane protein [bacterium]|nr:YqaE/Pmp3 family membrane protein [bacterium]
MAKQNKILLIILAIILPPLAVYLKKGVKKDFWINILLTICFYLPGIIHALYLITK